MCCANPVVAVRISEERGREQRKTQEVLFDYQTEVQDRLQMTYIQVRDQGQSREQENGVTRNNKGNLYNNSRQGVHGNGKWTKGTNG
jgi:hypothetical protein